MSPADEIAINVKKAAMKREGVTDLERRMRKIQKAAGGGRVQLSLALTGEFIAHVYPTNEQSALKARERMKAMEESKVKNTTYMELLFEEEAKSLANGRGKTIDLALAGLEKFYGVPAK